MIVLQLELERTRFTISVDLTLPSGSSAALYGPHGAGKSSVLSAMMGTDEDKASGFFSMDEEVFLNTRERPARRVPPWQRRITLMEQTSRLFPHLSVLGNVQFGARTKALADEWLNRLGLGGLRGQWPSQLSGGQRQRVALARALAMEPRLLLMDEPFSALDALAREQMQQEMRRITRETGLAVLLVTHSLSEAQYMAERIVVMDEGKVVAEGPSATIVHSPRSWRAAQILGYRWRIRAGRDGWWCLHPDRFSFDTAAEGVALRGVVEGLHATSGIDEAVIRAEDLDGQPLRVRLSPTDHVDIGAEVAVVAVRPPLVRDEST